MALVYRLILRSAPPYSCQAVIAAATPETTPATALSSTELVLLFR